ncbi:MAG: sigma-70 family RNA polymerase sigma factor [Selenomonadaceae bacterium]|nr:sigma-70 family RNA polymerase sigma factor [Selenomonadaceae bacterium]
MAVKEFSEDVELYLEEVRRIPLLTAQEFHMLLLRAADGDEDAQSELVNANLRLVVNIARNYIGHGAAFSDLIQEGNIGLMKAVKKFSTKGSATFIEYAEECIEAAIVRGLREMEHTAQVSLDTPIDERTYNDRDKFAVEGDFVEGLTLADFVEDSKTPTHFDRVNHSQMRELLREVLNTLPPYEKKVLALRFGLEDGRIHSVDEVARIFKVSGNTIKTVETKALKKLRQPTCSAKLKDFY